MVPAKDLLPRTLNPAVVSAAWGTPPPLLAAASLGDHHLLSHPAPVLGSRGKCLLLALGPTTTFSVPTSSTSGWGSPPWTCSQEFLETSMVQTDCFHYDYSGFNLLALRHQAHGLFLSVARGQGLVFPLVSHPKPIFSFLLQVQTLS